MADPTLVASDLTWTGWSAEEMIDEVLRPFGLTNDSTTGRVLASTDEARLARDALRLASTYLNSQYPSIWARRIFTATWISGDHSIALPAGCKFVERVFYGGLPLDSVTVEDRTRFTRSDESGGGWKTDSLQPRYYYISGITDEGGTGLDWRMVLRILPTPGSGMDTEVLSVHFIAKSPDFLPADDSNIVEFDTLYHDWLVNRAVEGMSSKFGAARAIHDAAVQERLKVEVVIGDFLEGTGEFPDRIRWQHPPLADHERR